MGNKVPEDEKTEKQQKKGEGTMPKYDYAMYTTADRENDAADWYDTCEEAVAAAQKAIEAGADAAHVGVMKFVHNGDCAWDYEIKFDADGATWSDDWTAREEMGFVQ